MPAETNEIIKILKEEIKSPRIQLDSSQRSCDELVLHSRHTAAEPGKEERLARNWNGDAHLITQSSGRNATNGISRESRLQPAQRLQVLESVMTGMAHEIRQALSAITMASSEAEYWKERGIKADTDDLLEDMANILKRCQRIDELLNYSGQFIYRDECPALASIDLNDVVGKVLKLMASRIMAHGIRLLYGLDQQPVIVWAARQNIEESLILFSNALCTTAADKQPGSISVHISTASGDDSQLRISMELKEMSGWEWDNICASVMLSAGGNEKYNAVKGVDEHSIFISYPVVCPVA